jgi:ABC-type transport system substrate-binding protein
MVLVLAGTLVCYVLFMHKKTRHPLRWPLALAFLVICCATAAPVQAAKNLTLGIQLLPATRGNPHQNVSLPGTLPLQAIFDTLTRIGPNGEAGPALAVSWDMESPTTWVFRLRDDVMFSNGEAFNAEAVVAAVDFLLSDAGRSETIGTHLSRVGVADAESRDRFTVAFTTHQPNAILPVHLDFLRVPPPQAFADQGPAEFTLNPIGSGPFKVQDWGDGRISLVANTTSWRKPKLDSVTLIQLADQASRLQGLLAGSLDVAFNVAAEDALSVEAVGGRLVTYSNPSIAYIQFVTTKPSPLADVQVRRALNYAVNKSLISDVMFGGAVAPASQIAHPQAFGFNPDLTPYPYDPARAQALLAQAGYGDGFKIVTLMVPGASNDDQAMQQIAADLARVGVTMELQRTTFGKYLEYMYQTGWPDPYSAFAMVTSGFDPLHGYRTRSCRWTPTYYCDEAVMPLIEQAEGAVTPEDRRLLVGEVLAYERDNPPGILMWQSPAFDALGPQVTYYDVIADVVPFHDLDVKDD